MPQRFISAINNSIRWKQSINRNIWSTTVLDISANLSQTYPSSIPILGVSPILYQSAENL